MYILDNKALYTVLFTCITVSELLCGVMGQHFSVLVLLDLSAEFDTTGHHILSQRLEHLTGIKGTALS